MDRRPLHEPPEITHVTAVCCETCLRIPNPPLLGLPHSSLKSDGAFA